MPRSVLVSGARTPIGKLSGALKTFQAVDLDDLDVVVADVRPAAEDPVPGDDEVVRELGAEDHDLVEAGAAVDRDRGVDVVLDLVVPLARLDLGLLLGRGSAGGQRRGHPVGQLDRAFGVRLGQGERADDELVVPGVAFQPQLGLVAVDVTPRDCLC